ncbi:uncharacterized protein GGS22DRAFT_11857 [Annulohypoxylon maeteangense]|uniref:uncharacterized protein n=1 Tax=Annulohypoxylon maeteangense TaxID=1927788 RepID=UPI002008CABA|nr:uncharacterized protein GGS22DRAFT_11857 [Annulohypoxylon maeteangense]KAI0890317.1 hypothetical protein GGS22DRAFT_11857 [Annulohypoxylon maeteangense]
MEQTFMTIHNLSPDANILFASESIADILGYQPQDVQGKSCFEFFHPEEVPFARSVHSRGVLLDKAAVLHYARIMSRDGRWISCECCFTIVHDVLVACTSIYRHGERSKRRALEAPHIRRIFSSSPRDPRYHMLEHLSPKFKMQPMEREPRAALILNRFTRTLTVMFATNAVSSILGVRPDQVQDKSFYECIAENCLADAIKCLESAKANDSIAYLRFWYRDPRREEDFDDEDEEEDENDEDEETEQEQDSKVADGDIITSDAHIYAENAMDVDVDGICDHKIKAEATVSPELSKSIVSNGDSPNGLFTPSSYPENRIYQPSEDTCHQDTNSTRRRNRRLRRHRNPIPTFELEAVVSCTSDGLVVVLRKARPPIPSLHPPLLPVDFENGLFAAPWSEQPIRPYYPPEHFYTFRPPLLPQYMPLREHVKTAGGPPIDQLMKSIRDVAVFAWAVVGINGNLAAYGRGVPRESSQPQDGLPAWDPKAPKSTYHSIEPQPPPQQWAASSSESHSAEAAVPADPRYVSNFNVETPQGCYDTTTTELGGGSSSYPNSSPWTRSRPSAPTFEPWRPYTQLPPSSQPSLSGFNQHLTEPWVEASVSYTQQNTNNYAIPTTQAHGFRDGPRTYRNVWQ